MSCKGPPLSIAAGWVTHQLLFLSECPDASSDSIGTPRIREFPFLLPTNSKPDSSSDGLEMYERHVGVGDGPWVSTVNHVAVDPICAIVSPARLQGVDCFNRYASNPHASP